MHPERTVTPMKLRDYNAMQADLAQRFANALSAFISADRRVHDTYLDARVALELKGPSSVDAQEADKRNRDANEQRQQLAYSLAARVQDLCGVTFNVTAERAF